MAANKAQRATAPAFMKGDGGSYNYYDKFSVTANFTVADTIDYLVPAGVDITSVFVQSDQLDTNGSPTAAFRVGYVAVDPLSTLTPVDNYFAAAGQTLMRTGGRLTCAFKPIKFSEDVYVRITVNAVCATFAAGDVFVITNGNCDGVA